MDSSHKHGHNDNAHRKVEHEQSHIQQMLNMFYPAQSNTNTSTQTKANTKASMNSSARLQNYNGTISRNHTHDSIRLNNNNHNNNGSLSLHTYCMYLLLICATIFFVFFVSDLSTQHQSEAIILENNRRACIRKFIENGCDVEIVPAIQDMCKEWKKCELTQQQVSKTTVFIKVCTRMLNLLLNQLGYYVGAAVVIGAVVIVCVMFCGVGSSVDSGKNRCGNRCLQQHLERSRRSRTRRSKNMIQAQHKDK